MIAAFDVDLCRWTWAIEGGESGTGKHGDHFPELNEKVTTILIEVTGPVMHRVGGEAEVCPYNKRRWMIYNAARVAQLDAYYGPVCNVLVAPSSIWTLGYKEAERQALAGIKPVKLDKRGRPLYAETHDVRECRAMIHLYKGSPTKWVSLHKYLENL